MVYTLSFRDNARDTGGPVLGGQLQQWSGGACVREGYRLARDLGSEPRVTFLIHGYNVGRTEGRIRLQKLAEMLKGAVDGALVATLWPGDTPLLGPLSFPFEGRDADDTAENLARFIGDVLRPATRLCFVTHSLGARVAMETIRRLRPHEFTVEQVCLMAAAIDDDALAHQQVYGEATAHAGRVAVLHSQKDAVLRLAYPVGDLMQTFVSSRDSPGLALGFKGPADAAGEGGRVPRNVVDKKVGHHNVNHGDYLPPARGGPNSQQRRAAAYARDVIQGVERPRFADDQVVVTA